MICRECNFVNKDVYNFCIKCGVRLQGGPVHMAAPAGTKASVQSAYHNNQVFTLGDTPLFIGRNPAVCQMVFAQDAPGVSGKHCQLFYSEERKAVTLVDLGSSYGTFLLDGTKLESNKPYFLSAGDGFCVGDMSHIVTILM